MRVLIACEESQTVCKAFRERGHEAYSCDLQECSGGHPEWHIVGDVLEIINGGWFTTQAGTLVYIERWDMMIAHPPCTYISAAGARWMYKGGVLQNDRLEKAKSGREFFMKLLNAPIKMKAFENPKPLKVVAMPPCTQVIQPYEFGDPFTKKTLLWLVGLPPLKPTNILCNPKPYLQSGATNAEISKIRGRARSKTFPGIARAMAEQWG